MFAALIPGKNLSCLIFRFSSRISGYINSPFFHLCQVCKNHWKTVPHNVSTSKLHCMCTTAPLNTVRFCFNLSGPYFSFLLIAKVFSNKLKLQQWSFVQNICIEPIKWIRYVFFFLEKTTINSTAVWSSLWITL